MDERLLAQLHQAQARHVTTAELAQALNYSASDVTTGLETLRAHGYEIEARPDLGYRLVSAPDRLIDVEIRHGLRAPTFGRVIQCFAATDSTMDVAHRLARAGAPEGAVVFAETQAAGRGRQGRAWTSPPGQGIYGSLVLRPTLPLAQLSTLTLTAAIGLARAVESVTELPIQIKWPNDLFLHDRKLGGILTELDAVDDQPHYVILGFGLNVNGTAEQLPPEAISLREALGRTVHRLPLIRRLLEELERAYTELQRTGFAALQDEWRRRALVLGRRVKIVSHTREAEGQAVDIDEAGALIVRYDTGMMERFTAGDVVKLW